LTCLDGSLKHGGMDYTIRGVPRSVDKALRQRARREGQSLTAVAIELLRTALGLEGETVKHRDLGDIAGSWVHDAETEAAIEEQRRVDPEP
jgi:plasmid stability protein